MFAHSKFKSSLTKSSLLPGVVGGKGGVVKLDTCVVFPQVTFFAARALTGVGLKAAAGFRVRKSSWSFLLQAGPSALRALQNPAAHTGVRAAAAGRAGRAVCVREEKPKGRKFVRVHVSCVREESHNKPSEQVS